MCACTEPVRTGIGAVCVDYDRPKWPITMLNHTSPVENTTRYEEASFSLETKEKKAPELARAPHY